MNEHHKIELIDDIQNSLDFGKTMYAMAGSPMKLEITKVRKYIKNKGM